MASSAACSNTSGKPGQGAWISLGFNSAGLTLLNDWTLSTGVPDDGFAIAPSLTDEQMWKQFDSANDGGVTSSQGGNCTGNCEPYLQLTYTADVAPQIDAQYPPDNYNSPTLTPELIASGHDPDTWPNASVQYEFTVYTASGSKVASSGLLSAGDWTVPSGDLSWGQTYYWTVQDYDGLDYSPTATTSYFSTPVPQPLVTSGLSQNESGPGFDAGSGDYTTTATDAKVATVGPALAITRDYNSQDPRLSGAFGAGWSSVLDMKVTPGQDGSSGTTATQVVTYPDGQQVAFGLTAGGAYAAPPGRYATLAAVSGGGFTLTDKNDTVYTFTQSLSSGGYGITSIADALGRTETFGYNSTGEVTTITSASGRTLTIAWGGSGAYPHVTSVTTGDATAGDSSTAQTWTYAYSGDELITACPPISSTACTAYGYTPGSDYPESVLNSGPHSYWPLNETSGSTAASAVLLHEGTDDGSYANVSLASAASGLAGSGAQVPDFNGTSSDVALPTSLGVNQAAYMSVSLWFRTTSAGGVLFSYQRDPLSDSTTTAGYTPALYIGSDGKLNAMFWDDALAPMTSPAAVVDGNWHQVVLTAAGNSQVLYLDGKQIGTKTGTLTVTGQQYDYLGAGFLGGSWPDEAHYQQNGAEGYATYYAGYLSDAAIWNRSLTPAEVSAMYAAGTHAAGLLTTVTRPSGSVYATISYDALTGRATSVTDANGGTWTINPPTVSGSSQVYVASVLGAKPQDYWRLADSGTTDAVDQVRGGTAVYSNVTQGVTGGPFSDATVDSFNGTSSSLSLPDTDRVATTGPGSIGLWFKTTGTGEVIYSTQSHALTAGATGCCFTPSLYVGADGNLKAEFWNGSTSGVITSKAPVNDGKWHFAVLAGGTDTQSMYLDGALQGSSSGTLGGISGQSYVAVGGGYLSDSWPDTSLSSTATVAWFTGDIAEVAWYPSQLTAAQVTAEWNASKYSAGLTPVQTDTVKDPGGHLLAWTYDMLNGGRVLSQTDARSAVTSYGYDVDGFQDEVVNPDKDVTQTGYDVRGNVVSKTTCQDQATDTCSTSYYTYYPNDTSTSLTPDPRNDVLLTYQDPRSASSSDTTYETKYGYNSLGELTAVTTPPVAGFPSGRTTSYAYTDGSTSAGGYNGAIPPKGLPYQVTTPAGAVTTTLYDASGDVAQVTDPDGLRTVYAYDGLGRKISETAYSTSYPNGLVTSYAYNMDGQVTTETDPPVTNRVTGAVHTAQITTSYDADGNMISQTVADTTGGDASRTVTRSYDSHDLLASETDAAGAKTSHTYNAYGKVATTTDPNGNVTDFTYDGDGNLLTTTLENYTGSPSGSQTAAPLVVQSRSYDPAGRLASVTDSMGRMTYYSYTDNGLVSVVKVENQAGTESFTTQSNTYDAAGNLIERVTGNGETTTSYTVDAANRVTAQTLDPSGLDRTTTISYTPDDQQATVTQSGPGGATQVTSYTYDPAGNMLSKSLYSDGSGHPTGWWKLNQASGGTVTDSSGTGNTASAAGVTWTGGAASFAGASGQGIATNGPVLNTTASFSVSAWVELPSKPSANEAVVTQAGTNVASFWLLYSAGSGEWEFDTHSADSTSATVYAAYGSPPSGTSLTGTWTHLVGVYDASTGSETLYVDGTATATTTGASAFSANGPLQIGEGLYGGAAGSYLDGSVDNVQVYPRVLSAAEVSALYGAGRNGGTTASSAELTTTWTRGERGLPTSMTDPDGNVTGYTYDAAGKLAVVTAPAVTAETYQNTPVSAHPVTTTGYDTFGDVTETEDPNGNVTTYAYDADSRQVSKTLPPYTPPGSSAAITATSTRTYDGIGQLTSATDALGNTTTYGYDQLGNMTSQTLPNGGVSSYTYDTDGERLSATGPTGAQVQATYDLLGRKVTGTQVERYNSTGSAQAYTTNYTYGAGGWLSQVVSPDGVSTQYAYDPAGETVSVTDGAGNVTGYGYDALGRRTTVTYPDQSSQVSGYDALGDVTSVQSLDKSGSVLASTSATYDGMGNELSSTDARGNTTTFTYDATGLVTQEVQPVSSSSSITTSFGYDLAGNETRYTDGDGNNWYYTYNPWNLQESRVEPATSQYTSAADSTFTTVYDADGRPVSVSAPGGVSVTSAYNSVGEVTGESGSGADAATAARSFGYDSAGNLTSAATSNTAASGSASNATSESFTYNDRGLVLTASGTAGSTSYAYNGDGQVLSVADAAGTTSYTYDTAGRLATLADPVTGTTAAYSYNDMSQVAGISYGSGNDSQVFTYDSLHRLSSDVLQASSGSTVASVSYGYNADGQISSLDTTGLAGAASNTYAYDEAGRLTSWDNGTATTGYGYDASGNLTRDGSKAYAYDARDELTSDGTNTYSYTARGTLSSEVTPSGTVTSSFDAYGNQASAGTQSYAYDALGRVTAAAGSPGQAGYAFSYAGATGAIASDGASAYTWDPSGRVLAGTGVPGGGSSGVLAFTDSHGDVVGQFAASGTAVAGSRAYDPWGSVTAVSGTVQGLLGFQSGWTDPVSGNVAMGARWYAPAAGGFTSADSVQVSPVPDPAAGNPFAYVGDAPLTGTDPSGHCWSGFGWACSAVHAVAHGYDVARHAVASAFDAAVSWGADAGAAMWQDTLALERAAERVAVSAAIRVRDAADTGIRAVHTVVEESWSYSTRAYHAVTSYAVRRFHRVVHAVRTAWHRASRIARAVVRHAARAAVWAGHHVQRAAAAAAHFAVRHAAAIGGMAAGLAVMAGCEAITGGAGSIACAAASGAAANAVSYGITAAQTGKFSWSALGQTTLDGAVQGAVSGGLGAGAGTAETLAADTAATAEDTTATAATAAEDTAGGSCPVAYGGMSFTAATRVLLATGRTEPVSRLHPGQEVLATDTRTGRNQAETITAVLLHHDTNLYNLKVKTAHGTEVIHTTSNHLFWVPGSHGHGRWVKAAALRHGTHLRTPGGNGATVTGGYTPRHHDGWMWDLTVPGNNDHDFYVLPAQNNSSRHTLRVVTGNTPVLVHNCTLSDRASEINNAEPDEYVRKNVTTVAVVRAQAGLDVGGNPRFVNVVAGAGDGLTSAQATAVGPGELMADNIPGTHAEQNALLFINKMGWEPIAGGTSRNVCRAICGNLIRGTGGRMMGEVYPGNGVATWRQRSFVYGSP